MDAGLSTDQVQALYDAHHQTVAAAGGFQSYYHGAPPAVTPDPYKYSRVGRPPLYYGPGNPNNERNADGSLTTLGVGRANDRGWNLPPGASPPGLGGPAEASPAGQGAAGSSALLTQINSELDRINKLSDAQRITALEGLAATYGGKLEVLDHSSGKLVDAGSWLSEERDRVQEHADQGKAKDALFSSLQSDLAKVNALPPNQRITALEGLESTYGGQLQVLDPSSGKSVDVSSWLSQERNRVQTHANQVKAKDALFSSLQSDLTKLDELQPSQRVTALEGLADTYGNQLQVLDSSGKSVDADKWLTGERDRVQRFVDDAKLAEVDRVPDSKNAALGWRNRREFRELTGRDMTGDPAKDQAILAQVNAADAKLAEVDRVPDSKNAALGWRNRREFRELTGQDMTGDPAKDQALANRVNAADAAQNEVDRVPDSRTAGLPGPETSDQAVKVAPNSNRPLELVVADAQKVQRSGPGHPAFQDTGSTTSPITTAELQRLADNRGTLVINGEEVDVASLVHDNVAYGSTQNRGRGGRQRGDVYQRDLAKLANHLTSGLQTGGVSRFGRVETEQRNDLTLSDLQNARSFTVDGVRYDDPQKFVDLNLRLSDPYLSGSGLAATSQSQRNQDFVSRLASQDEAAVAEFMTTVNEARRNGRFGLDDENTVPYFNPNTKNRFNPIELLPVGGLGLSVVEGRQPGSHGGTLTTPTEHSGQVKEAAFAAAEIVTFPLSGPAIAGAKNLVRTIKAPATGTVALNRFRRETADLVASGLDTTTARQVAASNQGQTVADMARLEKGLTSPKVDPYAGLSTGQQTFDDTARAVNNRLEIERKLTGNRETPETLARRLQNQQHGTNQKTADTLIREIDNKAAANKVAFLRGQGNSIPGGRQGALHKRRQQQERSNPNNGRDPHSRFHPEPELRRAASGA